MKKFLLFIGSLFTVLIAGVNISFVSNNTNFVYANNQELILDIAGASPELLPEEYCMRDEYIIYAQHQDKHGYCWNFAASMAASTTIMKATNEYYDFSELWTGVSYNMKSNSYKLGAGGSFTTHNSAKDFAGLMLESDLPYQNSYIVSNENASNFYNFYSQYSNEDLADCLEYDSKTGSLPIRNVYAIKNHIYNHGSVYMSFYFKQGFIPENGVYYKVPNQKNTNSHHAVSVIGWDDNFEKEVYIDGSDTPIIYKGAWIILNSYTENNGIDGVNLLFYEDTNISGVYGYKYVQDTSKDLYFYDKIESGYEYPTNVVGKYYGDLSTSSANTKQKNIFYDDVDLEYSYIISEGAEIKSVDVYLNNVNVSDMFDIDVNSATKRFSIAKDNVPFGNYKVLVTYGNGGTTKTYLNNFFVTHGLIREEVEFSGSSNEFGFNKGKDLEYYSHNQADKNYVIYTNKLSGVLSFNKQANSIYTETPIELENISYEITNGVGCNVAYKVTSASGYGLVYNFYFEYCEDLTKQPVYVFYDLDGGINNPKNYHKELASENSDLALYEPTREGYTFAGWYLDYGNGSKKISNIEDVYYIDWEDIYHMGDVPTLNALSYYKSHYNNSNIVFVYAHWEEIEYYDVKVSINGEGSVKPNKDILISANDSVIYNFKASSGWNLFEIKINGVKVSDEELQEIIKNGLLLQNLNQDVDIEATFIEGTKLILNVGENIKNAYVATTLNGTAYKFYDGDLIGNEFFPRFNRNEFFLAVELYDDDSGYTYILSDVEDYIYVDKGIYKKEVNISGTSAIMKIDIADAIKKEIVPVHFSYETNSYILDHYISVDKNATSGVQGGGDFVTGQIIYLFVKIPSKTNQYTYSISSDFEKLSNKIGSMPIYPVIKEDIGNIIKQPFSAIISPGILNSGGGWYRKEIVVDQDKADFGVVDVQRSVNTYYIYFKNWDGSTIYYEKLGYGSVPVYSYSHDGKNIKYPTRNSDRKYDYVFVGWDSFFSPVTGSKTYTAVFDKVARQYNINVEMPENGSVGSNGNNIITCEDTHTYIFTPNEGYKVKDVKIDGVSVGSVNYYTFSNVDCSHTLSVEFELIKFNVQPIIEGEGSISCENLLEEVNYGEDRELVITAKKGWTLVNVYVDGKKVQVVDNKLKLSSVKSDVEVLAVFEKNDYTLLVANCLIILLMMVCIGATLEKLLISLNKKSLLKRKK